MLDGVESDLPRPFGRLTLLKQIAQGGMGELYLAATGGIEGTERPCVVKIIRRDRARDQSFAARFLDEARIQSQLRHPGVAQVLEASIDPSGKAYIVMEYVEGQNLSELRHRAAQTGTRLTWPEVAAIGVALGEALDQVHRQTDSAGRPLGIAHRDLSPQNVMVSYAGEVKLIDFGTASGHHRRCQTVAGLVFAKPGYVAPEVANGEPASAPADLYAFGIILWELLLGRRFLTGDATAHLAAVAAGERSPGPVARAVGAPAELDAIVARLTAYRVEDRYQHAAEALLELVELLRRAPALPQGERSIRSRIARCVGRLYPAEPARSRAEFARLLDQARRLQLCPAPAAVDGRTLPGAAPSTEQSLLPGTRYRLLRELGRGGMATVYEAEHVDLGRPVALKLLNLEYAADPAFGARFRNEARALAGLRHRHLVGLYDYGLTAEGRPYAAMELLQGESLESVLERKPKLDWREAVRICIQACQALEAIHQAGVIHRDLKPGNLFLTREGDLKLLDFGIACVLGRGSPEASPEMVLGTPEYMAPEQARGQPGDERSDVYALGKVLEQMVTGISPGRAAGSFLGLPHLGRARLAPGRALPKGAPVVLEETIVRATDSDPDHRFQSAAEMRSALETALREPERRRLRRRRVARAALVLAGLGVLGTALRAAQDPEVVGRAWALIQPASERIAWLRPEAVLRRLTGVQTPPADPGTVPAPPLAPTLLSAGERPDSNGKQLPTRVPSAGIEEVEQEEEQLEGDTDQVDEPGELPPPPAGTTVARTEPAGESGRQADRGSGQPEALELELSEAQRLMQEGKRLSGLGRIRRLGKRYPRDARVLRAWSEAAVETRCWGEAYRVARQWTEVDQAAEARLTLARIERALGRRHDAIRTVTEVLKEDPGSEPARDLLAALGANATLARN